MDIGTALLYTALVAAVISLALTLKGLFIEKKVKKATRTKELKHKSKKANSDEDESLAQRLDIVVFMALSFAILLLAIYFATSDFSIHYVWEHSGKNLDLQMKLAGIYSGQSGSILLWTFLMAASLVIEDQRRKWALKNGKEATDDRTYALARAIAIFVIVAFLAILTLDDPFTPVHTFTIDSMGPHGLEKITIDPSDYPEGNGMNPMLRNFWMAIHPPVLFLGYAFALVPFASAVAGAMTKNDEFSSLFWSRLSWLFLTLGIGIGAVWAYEALDWGGYWAWDPVETSSLVPWFTLTALLHSLLARRKRPVNRALPPLYASSTILLVLFATYVTRSGAWSAGSVHAWSESAASNALLALMVGLALFAFGIVGLRYFKDQKGEYIDEASDEKEDKESEKNKKVRPEKEDKKEKLDYRVLTGQAGEACLAIMALLLFAGLLISRGTKASPSFYEPRLFPFIAIMLVAIPFCSAKLDKKRAIPLAAISLACAAAVPALVSSGAPPLYSFGSLALGRAESASIMIAPSMFLLGAACIGLTDIGISKVRFRRKFYMAGPHIAHIGVALLILGYASSSTWAYSGELELENEKGFVGNYEFEKGEMHVEELSDRTIYTVELIVYKDGAIVGHGEPKFVYYKELGRSIPEVEIINLVSEDIHITISSMDPDRNGQIDRVAFEVHINPGMNLLWSGMCALALGIAVRFSDGFTTTKNDKGAKVTSCLESGNVRKVNEEKSAWEKRLDEELEKELSEKEK